MERRVDIATRHNRDSRRHGWKLPCKKGRQAGSSARFDDQLVAIEGETDRVPYLRLADADRSRTPPFAEFR